MALDPVRNFATVIVDGLYDASATAINLTAGQGAKLPAPASEGAFNLVWWNYTDYSNPENDPNVEIVRCTARSTDALTVTRAQEGSGASTKNTSGKTYYMRLAPTKKLRDDLTAQALGASGTFSTLTISSGEITITSSCHHVDTEAAAAEDDLVTINGGTIGQVVVLKSVTTARIVKIKHGTGNIVLPSSTDVWLASSGDAATFVNYTGTNWLLIAHSSWHGWSSHGTQRTQTVTSNTITPTSSRVGVNNTSGNQTINTITPMPEGVLLMVRVTSSSYSVTFKDRTDNLYLAKADFVANNTTDHLMLVSTGASWIEVARSDNG
jgi:hypothetical protein